MRRYLLHVLFLASLGLLLMGCGKEETSVIETPKEKAVEEQQEIVVEEKPKEPQYKHFFPLTGVPTNDNVNQRAFAVMINNHPKARPQSGLHKADIVYEVLAEGFITRYLAIFQQEYPDVIGPIRSSRPYYIDLSNGYNAIYVAYGGSTDALLKLDNGSADYLNGIKFKNGKSSFEDDSFFYRANFRNMPHNVYMTKEKLLAGSERRGFSLEKDIDALPFLTAEENESLTGSDGSNIQISYSKNYKVRYEYVMENDKYIRYIGKTQTTDYDTKEPIELDTIFIVEAEHKVLDNVGRRAINLNDGGRGILLRKGKREDVLWKIVQGRILPFREDGQALSFASGHTWINIIPTSPGLEKATEE